MSKQLDNGEDVKPVYQTEYYTPVGAHTSTALGAAAVTDVRPAGATQVILQALTQNVRFRLDGVNPTAAVGFQILAGSPPVIIGVAGADIRYIRELAGAVLERQWVA